jgi:succinyl-CoA synthetase beta subunit
MKRLYLIQYKVKEATKISERIKSLGGWMHYFEGSWIIESTLTAKEIYEKISIDYEKEWILIMELNKGNYWGVMPKEAWEWLGKR